MTRPRSGLAATAIGIAMLVTVACGQAPASAAAAPVAKKRVAPEAVDPVVIGATRFEAPLDGKVRGFGQNGGLVIARDTATGAQLWVAKVYPIAYRADMEGDKQDIFIIEMKPTADGRALLLADERGRRWRLDLASHATTPDTTP